MPELETCVVSPSLIDHVSNLVVIKTTNVPSDHAPISISLDIPETPLQNMLAGTKLLGEHAVLRGTATQTCPTNKPIKFSNTDKKRFVDNVSTLGDDAKTAA